jgi:uncharacterized membrane protein
MGFSLKLKDAPVSQPSFTVLEEPWLGRNVVSAAPDTWYLPVYLTTRTILSFVGAILVVISLWMVGFALDESEEDTANELSENSYGLGVALGIFFGKVSEVIITATIAWIVFVVAAVCPILLDFGPFFSLWPLSHKASFFRLCTKEWFEQVSRRVGQNA